MPSYEQDLSAVARIDVVPRILDVVCRMTGMGFAAVARVTEDRWIACAVRDTIGFGLPVGGELKVESTICHEIRASRTLVAFDNADESPEFCGHHTPLQYGLKSYISVPIILANGEFFGTLCAIDPRPARVNNPETIQSFQLFSELIAMHLDSSDRLDASESALRAEREMSDLRERFIAILGHDLRTPLAAIDASALVLVQPNIPPGMSSQMGLRIRKSVVRMAGMIGNILDFARGRLGGGLTLDRREPVDLSASLEQVVNEMRSIWPDRSIVSQFALTEPVSIDGGRLSQLLSNLLSNAISHGAAGTPIQVTGRSGGGEFALTVSNAGAPIAPELVERLFHPFTRGAARSDDSGLGLGLYIASEIAKAHGGALSVSSTTAETRFTFAMPVAIN